MDSTVWAAIITAAPPTIVAYLAWRRTKPVSNGFAPGVTASLARIEQKIDGHINDDRAHLR